jgi:hypothetical protein
MCSWWTLHAATLFRCSFDTVLRSQVLRGRKLLKDLLDSQDVTGIKSSILGKISTVKTVLI